jgi:hypothetical protein
MTGIPKEALARRLAIVGTTGSGKTYTAKGGVERKLKAGERVVIIDPLDVWWGLRLDVAGKAPSPFELVIFGGKHADMQISENGGKLLGEAVATAKESCIVSLGTLRTEAARRRFMVAFLDTLVVDEADLFAPQKPFGGHAEMLLHLMEEIVRRGRVRGFLPWLISQRPAIVNKNVLSQVDGMVAMQLTGAHDRGAIEAWIEGHSDRKETKELLASLAGFEQGHGLLWVPRDGILKTMHFPANITFDSSRTPKRGEKKRDIRLKPLNLDKLKDKLATVEAETKANDPSALKKQVAELQAQLRKAKAPPSPAADPGAIAAAESRGNAAGYRRGAEEWHAKGFSEGWIANGAAFLKAVEGIGDKFARAVAEAKRQAALAVKNTQASESGSSAVQPPAPAPISAPAPVLPRARNPSPAASGDGRVTPKQQAILDAIAWMASLGSPEVDKGTVAFLADASPTSSAYANNLGAMRSAGLIDYPAGGMVALTAEGQQLATAPDGAPTHAAIMEKIARKLPPAQIRILRATAEAFPDDVDKNQLASSIGASASSSAYANNLGRLRTMGFIAYPSKGRVRASERLFP